MNFRQKRQQEKEQDMLPNDMVNNISVVMILIIFVIALNLVIPTRMVRKSRKRAASYTVIGIVAFLALNMAEVYFTYFNE